MKLASGILLASLFSALAPPTAAQSGALPLPMAANELLPHFEHRKWKAAYPTEPVVTDMKVGVLEFGLDDHRFVFEGRADDSSEFVEITRRDEGDFEAVFTGSIETPPGASPSAFTPFFGIELDLAGSSPLVFRFLGASWEESIGGYQAFAATTGGAPLGTPVLFPGSPDGVELRLERVASTVNGSARRFGEAAWAPVFSTTIEAGLTNLGFGGANIAEGQQIAIRKFKATGDVAGPAERPLIDQIDTEPLARELQAHAALSMVPPDTATALMRIDEAIAGIGEAISAIDTAGAAGTLQESTQRKKAVRSLDKARKSDIKVREVLEGIATPPDPMRIDAMKQELEDAILQKQLAILALKGFKVKKRQHLDAFFVDC